MIYETRKEARFCTDETGEVKSVDFVEIRGKSTEEKPVKYIADGSSFLETDTGTMLFFDEASGQWLNPWGGDGDVP